MITLTAINNCKLRENIHEVKILAKPQPCNESLPGKGGTLSGKQVAGLRQQGGAPVPRVQQHLQ